MKVMTQIGLPCVFPFFYKQQQFSTCTQYSSEPGDLVNSHNSDPYEPLLRQQSGYSKKPASSPNIPSDMFLGPASFSSKLYEVKHEDFTPIASAQVPTLSEINSDRRPTQEIAWCAVAVDHEGVVTMKSNCVGSFLTGIA